jgi:predicted transcriptional regulator
MIDRMNQNLGSLAAAVMQEFLENGRLTLNECVMEILEHYGKEEFTETQIINMVGRLVKGYYLQRIEVLEEDKDEPLFNSKQDDIKGIKF